MKLERYVLLENEICDLYKNKWFKKYLQNGNDGIKNKDHFEVRDGVFGLACELNDKQAKIYGTNCLWQPYGNFLNTSIDIGNLVECGWLVKWGQTEEGNGLINIDSITGIIKYKNEILYKIRYNKRININQIRAFYIPENYNGKIKGYKLVWERKEGVIKE